MLNNTHQLKNNNTLIDRKEVFWTPLDNAAKIFPAIRSKEHTTVLRIAVELNEPVKIKQLFSAVSKLENRFPYFRVQLKKGFFWYYLEQVNQPIITVVDSGVPCKGFYKKDINKQLLRVLARKNRISIEFSHILTDGHGALQFLNTLIYYYFKESGKLKDDAECNFIDLEMDKEELEDAYNRHFKENVPPVIRVSKAFHIPYPLRKKPRFDVLLASLSIAELKKKSSEKGVTITDYLVAVYLWTLQSIYGDLAKQKRTKKNSIARIQVPINLRNIYPSKTMRNFSLFVMPEIDLRLGHYSFEEILKIVHHKMQLETDEKLIKKIISRNVGSERRPLVRGIPLALKSMVLRYKYYSEGANQYSGVITNLGKIHLPKSISEYVKNYIITPPPPNKKLKINCGVIGFQDTLILSFGNITKSKELERKFLKFLVQQDIKVKLSRY